MFRYRLGSLIALLIGYGAHAQVVVDTLTLPEHEVTALRRSSFAAGTKVQVVDSATMLRYRSSNLGELLANESPVFVKSYGLGSLATTAFRGGSASHTAILWNGFNIGSPMNGQIDLSLIPVHAVGRVELQYGGASTLWGSGAVGGTIHLTNEPGFSRGTQVESGVSMGSFGDRREHVLARWSNARWSGTVGLFQAAAANDLHFRNTALIDAPWQRQRNASFQQAGLITDGHYRINAQQRISLRYWYQESDRQIPATLTEASSTARQVDRSHRISAEWQRLGKRTTAQVRTAYFDEALTWHAFAADAGSFSTASSSITEGELAFSISSAHTIDVGVHNTWSTARAQAYRTAHEQVRTAAFIAYRFNPNSRSRTTLSARQEQVSGTLIPFTWSLGSDYQLSNGVTAKANVAHVYRIPTLNDRYWSPGGNPDLLPENGYSGEVGIAFRSPKEEGRVTLTGEVTVFTRSIHDWIIWLPGPAYWSPQNVMQVWSRGIESHGSVQMRVRDAMVRLDGMTNYVLSTNEVAKSTNDASVGKQLIYVPRYSGNAGLSLVRRHFTSRIGAHYTGYRYTSTDHSEFLEPFVLVDASISCQVIRRSSFTIRAMAQAFNVFAEEYQAVRSRPMPGRSFQVGITVAFDRPFTPKTGPHEYRRPQRP